MRSCLYVGRLRDERCTTPEPNGFTYPVYSFLIDLDEIDGLVERGLFQHNRRGLLEPRRHAITWAALRAARWRRGVLCDHRASMCAARASSC